MTKDESNKIKQALIKVHCFEQYFDGMDMLCHLVEWKSFQNISESIAEQRRVSRKFNAWVKNRKGVIE